jgi:hypothetical protein
VSDIAKAILGGGWSLVAGWLLPTAVNVFIFAIFVLPSLHGISLADELSRASIGQRSLAALAASVVVGLILNALQVPLYRILEGYLFWPQGLASKSKKRQLRAKELLADRREWLRLRRLKTKGPLKKQEDQEKYAELEANLRVHRFAKQDEARTEVQRAILSERLRRYPVDEGQMAPTRLGNAIRRHEEYGYQRYLLDSQALWYELTGSAPKQLTQQVDAARAGVDFFICLLYGNLLVALIALVTLSANDAHHLTLLVTAAILITASFLWYRLAVVTTDDWALAVRALVDVGREPLAAAVGLDIPKELSEEREMWRRYGRFVKRPYDANRPPNLDEFRSGESKAANQRLIDRIPRLTVASTWIRRRPR